MNLALRILHEKYFKSNLCRKTLYYLIYTYIVFITATSIIHFVRRSILRLHNLTVLAFISRIPLERKYIYIYITYIFNTYLILKLFSFIALSQISDLFSVYINVVKGSKYIQTQTFELSGHWNFFVLFLELQNSSFCSTLNPFFFL